MKTMKPEKIDIRGVKFDNVNMEEAVAVVSEYLASANGTLAVYTPNSEIVQLCIEKNEYYEIINSAGLIIPDGIGVVKASRILKTPLKCKVAGIELGENTLKLAADKGYNVYFMGGKPGVAEKAAELMKKKYPSLKICGTHDGYFKKEGAENDAVIHEINSSGAEILFVCLGVPAQENWIYTNKSKLPGVKVMLALGGSLDGYAGNAKRAPKIFIKLGLEWLYRLMREPSRIGRMMALPRFYFGTWKYKLAKK